MREQRTPQYPRQQQQQRQALTSPFEAQYMSFDHPAKEQMMLQALGTTQERHDQVMQQIGETKAQLGELPAVTEHAQKALQESLQDFKGRIGSIAEDYNHNYARAQNRLVQEIAKEASKPLYGRIKQQAEQVERMQEAQDEFGMDHFVLQDPRRGNVRTGKGLEYQGIEADPVSEITDEMLEKVEANVKRGEPVGIPGLNMVEIPELEALTEDKFARIIGLKPIFNDEGEFVRYQDTGDNSFIRELMDRAPSLPYHPRYQHWFDEDGEITEEAKFDILRRSRKFTYTEEGGDIRNIPGAGTRTGPGGQDRGYSPLQEFEERAEETDQLYLPGIRTGEDLRLAAYSEQHPSHDKAAEEHKRLRAKAIKEGDLIPEPEEFFETVIKETDAYKSLEEEKREDSKKEIIKALKTGDKSSFQEFIRSAEIDEEFPGPAAGPVGGTELSRTKEKELLGELDRWNDWVDEEVTNVMRSEHPTTMRSILETRTEKGKEIVRSRLSSIIGVGRKEERFKFTNMTEDEDVLSEFSKNPDSFSVSVVQGDINQAPRIRITDLGDIERIAEIEFEGRPDHILRDWKRIAMDGYSPQLFYDAITSHVGQLNYYNDKDFQDDERRHNVALHLNDIYEGDLRIPEDIYVIRPGREQFRLIKPSPDDSEEFATIKYDDGTPLMTENPNLVGALIDEVVFMIGGGQDNPSYFEAAADYHARRLQTNTNIRDYFESQDQRYRQMGH